MSLGPQLPCVQVCHGLVVPSRSVLMKISIASGPYDLSSPLRFRMLHSQDPQQRNENEKKPSWEDLPLRTVFPFICWAFLVNPYTQSLLQALIRCSDSRLNFMEWQHLPMLR